MSGAKNDRIVRIVRRIFHSTFPHKRQTKNIQKELNNLYVIYLINDSSMPQICFFFCLFYFKLISLK